MAADLTTATTAAAETMFMQLNASELTAIIMKGSPQSNDRDAGFCSGSSEGGDDCFSDNLRMEPSSPTDNSEDSLEVKVMPISLVRNKRKSSEPSKVVEEKSTASQSNGPLKKRIRYSSNTDSGVVLTPPVATVTSPPPPPELWDPSQILPHEMMPNPAQVFVRHPGVTTLHRLPLDEDNLCAEQEEPLALVLKKPIENAESLKESKSAKGLTPKKRFSRQSSTEQAAAKKTASNSNNNNLLLEPTESSSVTLVPAPALSLSSSSHEESSLNTSSSQKNSNKPQQRNYKNMTRERRIEANARERSRVHTISAAYETLRKAVPSYSNNQKLSKLSVLRVACSYILTLSRMAGYDYSQDESEPSIASCFDAVTATIQTEGKIRKKKEDEK